MDHRTEGCRGARASRGTDCRTPDERDEAERELPPVLQVAFARHPRAREGWDAMSPSRRRGHLFGIFYYRTPDAQGRRIDKMLEDATVLAEKISHKDHKGKRD
jgi:uncharacterized protein YdeI (YjbR/CyaY-like superfamily)